MVYNRKGFGGYIRSIHPNEIYALVFCDEKKMNKTYSFRAIVLSSEKKGGFYTCISFFFSLAKLKIKHVNFPPLRNFIATDYNKFFFLTSK